MVKLFLLVRLTVTKPMSAGKRAFRQEVLVIQHKIKAEVIMTPQEKILFDAKRLGGTHRDLLG